jgi:hypothetical protein
MPIPNTVNDSVAYAPRNIYATENVLVDIDDDNRLDIYGDVYLNGQKFNSSPVIDVRAYGAKGDNITDDTAAIQSAINAAAASSGGIVLFPEPSNTYKVTSTLTVPADGIKLQGPGRGVRCIDYTGTGTAIRFGSAATYVFRVEMDGVRLTNLSGSAAIGLELYVKESFFNNVLLNIGFTEAGIKLCDTSPSNGCWSNRFMNCMVYNGAGDGLVSLRGTNSNLFVGCHFTTNAGDNVFIPYTNGTEFIGCQFENAGSGYEIHVSDRSGLYPGAAAVGLVIEACYFETKPATAGARALMMDGTSATRFSFNHCKVYGMSIATYAVEGKPLPGGSVWGEVSDCTILGVVTAAVGATTNLARIYVSGRVPFSGSFNAGSALPMLDNAGLGRGCSWNQSDQEILLTGKLHVTGVLLVDGNTTPRVATIGTSATPAITVSSTDLFVITALATAITSVTVINTPSNGQILRVAITDNGTARALAWGASFEPSGTIPLPTTTVINTRLDVTFIYNSVTLKWRCIGVA